MNLKSGLAITAVIMSIIAWFSLGGCAGARNPAIEDEAKGFTVPPLPDVRTFFMAMTPFPYDYTPEAIEQTYDTLEKHCDFIIHHFDEGVPWPEVFEDKPWPAGVEQELALRVSMLKQDRQVFLAVTPISPMRDSLAGYWGTQGNMERPGDWKQKDFDDPDVIAAYTNFCRRMIQEFRPDYMAYGIEVNLLATKSPARFDKFLVLATRVRQVLKTENPELPLILTIQIDQYDNDAERFRETVARILPLTDFIVVSSYPVGAKAARGELPKDWFSRIAALAPEKPFAVAETGFIAENLVLEKYGVRIPGSEKGQAEYVHFLLHQSSKLNARFVVWFVSRDFDALWEKLAPLGIDEIFKLFRDMGLFDEAGTAREALRIWDQWLALPSGSQVAE